MANFSFGVKSIKAGGIDAITGLPTGLADVGDVYEGTATLDQEDAQITEHYSEFKNDPVASVEKTGKRMFSFSLMDTSADTLVAWLGGTPDVWNAPEQPPVIEKSLAIETEDGTIYTIHRAKITGKLSGDVSKTGKVTLDIVARVLQPKVADVPSLTVTDPA
jgi:hypothetical protein